MGKSFFTALYHGVLLSFYKLHWWLSEENMKAPHIPPINLHVQEILCIHVCAFGGTRARRGSFNKPDSSSQ